MFAAGIAGADNDYYTQNPSDETKLTDAVPEEADLVTECPPSAIEEREGTEYPEFIRFTYYSDTCGMDRGANVLLPAGYSEKKKYPVLYMLHGIFGDENTFKRDGNLNTVWTNMASDGKMPEMI